MIAAAEIGRALGGDGRSSGVDEAAARDDCNWFGSNPGRLFRARVAPGGLWLAQRTRDDVILRTLMRQPPKNISDTDLHLGALWYEAAFNLPPPVAAEAVRKLLRNQKRRRS